MWKHSSPDSMLVWYIVEESGQIDKLQAILTQDPQINLFRESWLRLTWINSVWSTTETAVSCLVNSFSELPTEIFLRSGYFFVPSSSLMTQGPLQFPRKINASKQCFPRHNRSKQNRLNNWFFLPKCTVLHWILKCCTGAFYCFEIVRSMISSFFHKININLLWS